MHALASLYFRRRRPVRIKGIRPYRFAIILSLLAALILLRYWQEQSRPSVPAALSEETYAVERIIDGDTLLLVNGARIRLIGADTPETVKANCAVEPFGPEATEFSKSFLGEGRAYLTFDGERLDRYGRFLAYVWRDEDMQEMLNEELIRAGLAEARTGYNFSQGMKTRFRRAEEEAKTERRGIWSVRPE